MIKTERFMDMDIATVSNDTPTSEIIDAGDSIDAHIVRVESPTEEQVEVLTQKGFFHRPAKIRYFLDISDIKTLDEYLGSLKSERRSEFKRILRDVGGDLYSGISFESQGTFMLEKFMKVYDQMIADLPRGRNPLRERHISSVGLNGFYDEGREGLYLFHRDRMVAGLVIRDFNDESAPLFKSKGGYFSLSYFGVDRNLKESGNYARYLILRALSVALRQKPDNKTFGCGMDTNLYGHHLALGVMPFKRVFGFKPEPDESYGRELTKFKGFDIFDQNAFLFYEYADNGLVPVLVARDLDSVQPLNRFVSKGEVMRLYQITDKGLVETEKHTRK